MCVHGSERECGGGGVCVCEHGVCKSDVCLRDGREYGSVNHYPTTRG